MERIENTVFISYRRKDISWALNVYQDLMHKGYDVFFDYTSITSGDFEQIIIGNIKARAHFVLILTPTTFDRCGEPGDWLRREIETAVDEKRNIIPLFFEDFNFGSASVSEKLTGKLQNISRYNGFNVYHDYFLEAMERLCTQFLNVPLDAVLHPVSNKVQEVVKGEQLAANKALLQILAEKPIVQQKPLVGALVPKKEDKPTPNKPSLVSAQPTIPTSQPEVLSKLLSQAKDELDRGDILVALGHYGKLIKKGKHLEETIRDLTESIYRYPAEIGIWQTLGDAYMRSNRLKEALEAYYKAEEL
jgi:tetratricopeptide (TPR) repeat protein